VMENADPPVAACHASSGLRGHFAHPRGWLGWIAGQLMTVTNRERSQWVQSLLDIRPDSRVLEIGFGAGADLRRTALRTSSGFVAGLDLSATMLRAAARRNRDAIRRGRMELRQGDASTLPYEPAAFDVVYAINSAQFWDRPTRTAREIHRVLRPGGLAA